MRLYAITVNVITSDESGTATRQLPSFLLNGDALGIVSEDHAAQIAREIVGEGHAGKGFSICAVEI